MHVEACNEIICLDGLLSHVVIKLMRSAVADESPAPTVTPLEPGVIAINKQVSKNSKQHHRTPGMLDYHCRFELGEGLNAVVYTGR